MTLEKLFRREAVEARRAQSHGSIILTQPIPLRVAVAGAAACGVALALLSALCSYTKRVTVSGQFVPVSGYLVVTAPQPGVVLEVRALEGTSARRGDPLFVISNERYVESLGATQAAISAQTDQQRKLLANELAAQERMLTIARATLTTKVQSLDGELRALEQERSAQQKRVELSQQLLKRQKELLQVGFATVDQITQSEMAFNQEKSQFASLERSILTTKQTRSESAAELERSDLTYRTNTSQLRRTLAGTTQSFIDSESRRRAIVPAPADGTVTARVVNVGQWVQADETLAALVPKGTRLQAELYFPSTAIGFVDVGDSVRLRVSAFAYQRFGQARGKVVHISPSAMAPSTLLKANGLPSASIVGSSEPMYRVLVELEQQGMSVPGGMRVFRVGMQVEADVALETRTLASWIFGPLRNLAGRAAFH